MFYQNVPNRWSDLQASPARGAVFRASAQDGATALRREAPLPESCLFDPQLYLPDLGIDQPGEYTKLLTRLATYPWFGVEVGQFDSGEGSVRAWSSGIRDNIVELWSARRPALDRWEQAVADSVGFQIAFGCTAIVLPGGLIADSSSDIDGEVSRLDAAIDVATRLTNLPLYATLALDERAIDARTQPSAQLIESLADSVTSRPALAGAYVVLATGGQGRERIFRRQLAASLLNLVRLISGPGRMQVIVNFTETFGLVTQAFGAAGFASGYGSKERRLSLYDYRDAGRGQAYPKFFSSSVGVDFRVKDFDECMRRRVMAWLLTFLRADTTAVAAPLLEALGRGQSTNAVLAWEDRLNNVGTASRHYSELLTRVGDLGWTPGSMTARLQSSEAAWSYLSARFEDSPLYADGAHLGAWRAAVDDVAGAEDTS